MNKGGHTHCASGVNKEGGVLTIVADNVAVGQHLFEVENDAVGGLEEPELCLELEGTSSGGEGGLSGGGGAIGLEYA